MYICTMNAEMFPTFHIHMYIMNTVYIVYNECRMHTYIYICVYFLTYIRMYIHT